ncbi:Aste57867_2678 [Aphanomyces stellatus]|uniref:Aste57867_2678 protein n=1 Tax=Aphanomyces stellatus TaxID=120398 RepID=A0A485KBU8_9STRA|nr:hypothetical protein As57867_002671 [Aphanomyces stellatus]VFT79872.1 Aste57867_2678 [Aphanomyces stellatus]
MSSAARVKFRQHRLLPSGCMHRKGFSNLHVVGGDIHGKYFAFCSTLAVYVYRVDNFQLHRLLSTADNLAGMAWCVSPQHGNWLAAVSLTRKVVLYDVDTEQILYETLLPSPLVPVSFQWNPLSTQLVIASTDAVEPKTKAGESSLFGWTIDHPRRSQVVSTIKAVLESHVTVIRFNTAGVLAIGFENGSLGTYVEATETFRLLDKKKPKKTTGPSNAVMDMQWDSLSTIYLLVATRDGQCALWEVTETTGVPLHTFDKQGSGTTALTWLPWASGLFVTANARTGNLKVWNVSQTAPLEHVRVRPSGVGIHSLALVAVTQHLVCASTDGSIALYHMPKRQLAWQSNPGHKETIFDIRYQPASSDVLATCGHDGAVRVWNVSTMECTHHFQGQDGITYSIAWSPHAASRLASASSLGSVFVWDLVQHTSVAVIHKLHTDAIYCLAWSTASSALLASSSRDQSVAIFHDDGDLVKRYRLPSAAFGCEWRPDGQILAVGCGDHVIRLFAPDIASLEPIRVLAAHDARVFHTVWYPHQRDHAFLASSSDDCTVRVWTIVNAKATDGSVVPYITLKGHSNYVRALAWSTHSIGHESSPLLLSGSWDCTIRIWDVLARECRLVVSDHLADVYGIATHAHAPCLFVSCSRDTSIRFWGLSTPATRRRVLHALATTQTLGPEATAPLVALAIETSTSSGVTNLFALLEGQHNTASSDGMTTHACGHALVIPPEDRLLAVTMEQARRLETGHGRRAKPTKLNHADQLRQAAQLYLKAGALKKYCRLMVELDDYEAALAIAPAISMAYWQELAAEYADALVVRQNENAASYFVVTNQVDKAIGMYQARGQWQDACIVAKAHADGLFPEFERPVAATSPTKSSRSPSRRLSSDAKDTLVGARIDEKDAKQAASEAIPPDDKASGNDDDQSSSRTLLHTTYAWLANVYSSRGEPILAACCHLAVAQVTAAIARLVRGDKLELAWIVAQWHGDSHDRDDLIRYLVMRCESLGDPELALAFAERLGRHEMAMVYARQRDRSAALRTLAHVPDTDTLQQVLKQHLADGLMVDAVRMYLLLDQINEGVQLALAELDEHIDDCATASWSRLLAMTHVLRSYDLSFINSKTRAHVLAYMALSGTVRAMHAQYPLTIVSYLIQIVHSQCHSYGLKFPISSPTLFLIEAQYASRIDLDKTAVLLKQLEQSKASWPPGNVDFQAHVVALQRQITQYPRGRPLHPTLLVTVHPLRVDLWLEEETGGVVVSGSRLPSAGQTRSPVLSLLTGEVIHGPFVRLEDDVSALTLEEAIMWHRVNPFSPLSTGDKLTFD